jgi:hypothetical protein
MWDHARGTPWPGKRGDSVAASEMNKIALAIAVFAAPAHADRPDLTPFVGSWAGAVLSRSQLQLVWFLKGFTPISPE